MRVVPGKSRLLTSGEEPAQATGEDAGMEVVKEAGGLVCCYEEDPGSLLSEQMKKRSRERAL